MTTWKNVWKMHTLDKEGNLSFKKVWKQQKRTKTLEIIRHILYFYFYSIYIYILKWNEKKENMFRLIPQKGLNLQILYCVLWG